ncbi:MAG: hypothetical protein Q9227_004757 [Pyrenula ochraceoflavens]
MRFSTWTALVALSIVSSSSANYNLTDDYTGNAFFNGFDFFHDKDPTNGFVKYVSMDDANSTKLAGYVPSPFSASRVAGNGSSSQNPNLVFLGVDATTNNPPAPGRQSTRVTSTKTYNKGLFIFDIQHAPTGCGVWPAAWLLADTSKYTWPAGGEIDIMEQVNAATTNQMTLHTSQGCNLSNNTSSSQKPFSGTTLATDCQGNMGCGISDNTPGNFGPAFNAAGGGIYAMEWTSQAIKVWFFGRNDTQIPSDLASTSSQPNPSQWGTPKAAWTSDACNIDDHFKDMQIIFNTALCGDWAGQQQIWQQDATCAAKASSCQAYVAGNGDEFSEAYWAIRSVRVYQAV